MNRFIPFALVLILILSSCGDKNKDCPELFQLTGEVIPYSDQYNVGDTITIKSNFGKSVYEKTSEEYFDMAGIHWNPGILIYQIDTTDTIYNITDNFHYLADPSLNFSLNGDSELNYLRGNYLETETEFTLEIVLIPLQSGVYSFEFGSSLFESQQDFPGKCKNGSFEACMTLNQGQDNNISLLNDSPNLFFNTWILEKPEERFYEMGSFAFTVTE